MSAAYRVCARPGCQEAFYPDATTERTCPKCRGDEITPDLFEALRFLPHRPRRASRPRQLRGILPSAVKGTEK